MKQRTGKLPTQSLIREWLNYDLSTGIFTWKKESRPMRPLIGQRVGFKNKLGYWMIGLRGHHQKHASRLAWIYVHGEIPAGMEIDHINCNRSDDRIENLRLATSSQQKMNRRVQSNNKSGLKGAYYHAAHKGKKWRSQLKVEGKYIFLGYFHTAEEAHQAYCVAILMHHGEFARL